MQLCSVGRCSAHEWLHELQFSFSEGRPGLRAHTCGHSNQPVKSSNNVHACSGGKKVILGSYPVLWLILQLVFFFAFHPQKGIYVELGCFSLSCKWDSFCFGCCRCPRVSPSSAAIRGGAPVSPVAAVGAGSRRCRCSDRVAAGRR